MYDWNPGWGARSNIQCMPMNAFNFVVKQNWNKRLLPTNYRLLWVIFWFWWVFFLMTFHPAFEAMKASLCAGGEETTWQKLRHSWNFDDFWLPPQKHQVCLKLGIDIVQTFPQLSWKLRGNFWQNQSMIPPLFRGHQSAALIFWCQIPPSEVHRIHLLACGWNMMRVGFQFVGLLVSCWWLQKATTYNQQQKTKNN